MTNTTITTGSFGHANPNVPDPGDGSIPVLFGRIAANLAPANDDRMVDSTGMLYERAGGDRFVAVGRYGKVIPGARGRVLRTLEDGTIECRFGSVLQILVPVGDEWIDENGMWYSRDGESFIATSTRRLSTEFNGQLAVGMVGKVITTTTESAVAKFQWQEAIWDLRRRQVRVERFEINRRLSPLVDPVGGAGWIDTQNHLVMVEGDLATVTGRLTSRPKTKAAPAKPKKAKAGKKKRAAA